MGCAPFGRVGKGAPIQIHRGYQIWRAVPTCARRHPNRVGKIAPTHSAPSTPRQAIPGRSRGRVLPTLRITKRIRRAVSALQSHLVRQLSLRPFDKEFRIEGKPTVRIGVELDHPAVESALVELRID